MRILIINWRSLNDPLAGGAERVTFEHAKRWVKNHGADVTWLSPRFNPNIVGEIVDGVKFKYIAYPLSRNIFSLIFTYPIFLFSVIYTYHRYFKGKVDVVIDEVHGLPYLTPWYVKEKIVVYIHEVAGEIWDRMYPFPINKIGRFLEKLVFRPYRKVPFGTGSYGTKNDLINQGIPEKNIEVINHGLQVDYDFTNLPKEKEFTIIFVNRLVKMKGPDIAINIFAEVKKQITNAKFWMVGKGEESYVNVLKALMKSKNLDKSIIFYGFVSEEEKYRLMAKSHVYLNTSMREGWGLGNLEANTQGTPAVSFNVIGNNESIKNTVSGYVCKNDDEMVKIIISLKNDPLDIENILNFPKQFNWEIQEKKFYNFMNEQ